jgi:hypothetical protein
MVSSVRHAFPFLEVAQAQKETTHNEALRIADVLTNLLIKDRDLATPPGSPVNGDTYLIAASPTGVWTGQAGKIGFYYDGWTFITAFEGLHGWVDDEEKPIIFSDGVWVDFRDGDSGTWTPTFRGSTVAGTQTYGTRTGQWIRVNKILHVWGTCQVTTLDPATAGDIQLTGIPLAALNTSGTRQPLLINVRSNITLSAGYSQFTGYLNNNGTVLNLSQTGSNVAQVNLTAAAAASGLTIDIQGTIRIN